MATIWDEETKSILIAYLRNGMSRKHISKKMNMTVDAVDGAIRRYDLQEHIFKKVSSAKFEGNIDFEELDDAKFEEAKLKAKLKWKIKKSKKSKNNNKPYDICINWSDAHIPHHNKPAVKAVLKLMTDIKFDKCIITGDFQDLGCIGHWNKNKHKTLEMARLKSDYIIGNSLLDEIDKRLPKDAEKIYMMGNHECLDDKTELLTKRGWVKYEKIKYTDKVLSLNPKTGLGAWVNIDRIIYKKFDGELNHLKTDCVDLMATDEHRLFNYNRRTKKYEYIPLKYLTGNRYQIPVNCELKENKKYPISDEFIQLIAWILTDGSIYSTYKYITIYQSKKFYKEIRELIKRTKLKCTETKRNRNIKEICGRKLVKNPLPQYEFHFNSESSKQLRKDLYNDTRDLPKWVEKLNSKQFKLFLDTLIKGDGSIHVRGKTARMLYGKKKFLEEVQLECIKRGLSASLSVYRQFQYRLNICDRIRHSFNGKNDFKKAKYDGVVWDLTVKNHNFMIRRNGKCHFTGNCWADMLLEEMPALTGLIEPETQLFLKERGYKITKYNELVKLGRLFLTHGIYAGANPIKKHLDELKVNILFAHTHTMGMRFSPSPARKIAFAGYNIGCLCDMSPDYMKNRPNCWTHGFAVTYLYDNGYFDVQLVRIIDGRFIFNGRIYDGNA